MLLSNITFEKKETIFGKEITFNAFVKEYETTRNGRYRQVFSDCQPDKEVLMNSDLTISTSKGLNECVEILKDLGYELIEANI